MLDIVVITGASRGIGSKIFIDAQTYAKHILALSTSISTAEIPNGGLCEITKIQLDLANLGEIDNIIRTQIDKIGPNIRHIGIVLCASQIGSFGGIFEADFREWSRLYSINVLGNLAVVKACLNAFEECASIRVIFFGGGGAAYGYPEFSAYSLTKVATVRAVENIAIEMKAKSSNFSAVVLAPGAVETDMLEKVIFHGGSVKTKTDISEPVNFVRRFLNDEIDSIGLSGRFLHVRDDLSDRDFNNESNDLFRLRRIE